MTLPATIRTKCVYFVGPGSTGKTTLAKTLHDKYNSDIILLTEVARKVLQKLGYNAIDISSDPAKCHELQKKILLAQFQNEKMLLERNLIYVSDRSAIDPIVYAEFYIKNDKFEPLLQLEEWKTMKLRYQDKDSTLIVLIEPNQEFLKDDGTRKMPIDLEDWLSFYNCFVSFMNQHEIPFKVIPSYLTNINERMDQVIKWM